jgi:hypothetical protein
VANMADVAPGKAGQMFGLCGTFASLAGIIATSSVGFIVERTGVARASLKNSCVEDCEELCCPLMSQANEHGDSLPCRFF